ncbi:FHIPEP family type III secretion protein [Pseudonocardia charpentierae]|uniref:FHIPEP family type III secretion protein n=1 Tax=Pseudonocardia charpentierae TaxID=3075545 RepID=A0ABU2NI94_9PSEU|nr:FHIPEP family type III secretion protein [Pseudonocardia sp. DSM 45834]MDT0353614.1 FHIPEP family type III secretion protein [Pseudonocardia sp. DSM 45834]
MSDVDRPEQSGPPLLIGDPPRSDILLTVAPSLFELVDSVTADRVAEQLGAATTPNPLVRLGPADNSNALVHIVMNGRELPLPTMTLLTTLAYVVEQPGVLLKADAVPALHSASRHVTEVLAEWLARACDAAVAADMDRRLRDPGLVTSYDGLSTSGAIELLIEPDYLRLVTTEEDWNRSGDKPFGFAREGLFVELGMSLPPIHLRRDPTLRPGGFAFRLPGLDVPPQIGLAPRTILVNDAAERLTSFYNVTATPAANPATEQQAAIVTADHRSTLESAGYSTWGPMSYITLVYADVVRCNAARFVTRSQAQELLVSITSAFPALGEAARENFSLDVLTLILRGLVREQISVRNLRRILELLLRSTDENVDPENTLAYVRAGLADQLAAKASREQGTVVVYLIDPLLENAVLHEWPTPSREAAQQLRGAVAAEAAYLAPTSSFPAILTEGAMRLPVYDALVPAFPRILVFSYADLPPEVNVQPVARISVR